MSGFEANWPLCPGRGRAVGGGVFVCVCEGRGVGVNVKLITLGSVESSSFEILEFKFSQTYLFADLQPKKYKNIYVSHFVLVHIDSTKVSYITA